MPQTVRLPLFFRSSLICLLGSCRPEGQHILVSRPLDGLLSYESSNCLHGAQAIYAVLATHLFGTRSDELFGNFSASFFTMIQVVRSVSALCPLNPGRAGACPLMAGGCRYGCNLQRRRLGGRDQSRHLRGAWQDGLQGRCLLHQLLSCGFRWAREEAEESHSIILKRAQTQIRRRVVGSRACRERAHALP